MMLTIALSLKVGAQDTAPPCLFCYNTHNTGTTPDPIQYERTKVSWPAFSATTVALSGFYTGFFIHEQDYRWGRESDSFYFDLKRQGKGIDKFNHFYAAQTQASIISHLYGFSGVKQNTAEILGAAVAFSMLSLIEFKDGMTYDRGFDISDEFSNLAGIVWYLGRQRIDFLQRFDVRWFYFPSEQEKLLPSEARFNEDYNGHSYFMSMRIWDLLPEGIQPYYPRFLAPAVGLSLHNWSPFAQTNGHLSYYISVNPDFKHIFPQTSKFSRFLTDVFNSVYIPAPAFELYPDPTFKLVFYGQK